MKTVVCCSSVVITVLILFLASIRLHPYYHLAKKQIIDSERMHAFHGDTLKIAFIGDSWATYHHDYNLNLESMLTENGLPSHVISIGNVGAKSKEIYMRLYSTTRPLLKEQPDYCVVSAGINDAVAKLGEDYFVHHYMLILEQLLILGIKPVVLEMPEVNYHAIASREKWTMKIRHVLSSMLTGAEMYGFESYRNALKKAINQKGLQSRIIYIHTDSWNADGYMDARDIYLPDETHLNARGYSVLDSCISAAIVKDSLNK